MTVDRQKIKNLIPVFCRLPTDNGSPGRTRTADPVINSHLLYLLSYRGIEGECSEAAPEVQDGRQMTVISD